MAYVMTFIIISFVGIFFRTYALVDVPRGFFTDEAAIGHNAYAILHTARDEYGKFLPLFFQSYGDYRLPVPIYANVPFIALFGPTDFAVRMTSAWWGIVGLIGMWLLVRELWGRWYGLCSYALLALSPWHIHLSRWGSEYIYFPTLFTFGVWFYVKALKNPHYILWASAAFGLGMYTYYPSIFITPLFLFIACPVFLTTHRRHDFKKALILGFYAALLYGLIIAPMLLAVVDGRLMTRWNSVDTSGLTVEKKISAFRETYLDHLTPDFLFFKGDIGIRGHFITRHSPRGIGQAYIAQALFFYIGIVGLYWLRTRSAVPLWALLVLYPLSSAITYEAFATRSIIGVIPVTIFTVAGLATLVKIAQHIGRRWGGRAPRVMSMILVVVFFCGIAYESFGFYNLYFHQFPKQSYNWDGFQYGYKQAMELYVRKYARTYDKLRISHRFNQSEGLQRYYLLTIPCTSCAFLENPIKIYEDENALYAARPEDVDEAKSLYPDYSFVQIDSIRPPGVAIDELKMGYFMREKKFK